MSHQSDYLESLKAAIFVNHKCKPSHRETAFVHVKTNDAETVWKGRVEIFDLVGHHEADTCYAWQNSENAGIKILAVLEIISLIRPRGPLRRRSSPTKNDPPRPGIDFQRPILGCWLR
jgi:hypothetical protein